VKRGSAVTNGGLDFHSQAYSGKLLGTSLKFSGVSYTLLGPGVLDGVRGATVVLPAGHFSTLNLLAASVNGIHASQTFTVTYTDGSKTILTQSLSDWYTPQHYSGESIALTMAYHLNAAGARNHVHVCGHCLRREFGVDTDFRAHSYLHSLCVFGELSRLHCDVVKPGLQGRYYESTLIVRRCGAFSAC